MTRTADEARERGWRPFGRASLVGVSILVILLGALFIVVSFLLEEKLEDASEPWSLFSAEFGIALIIAGILTYAVEGYLREQLFDEIEQKVSAVLTSFETSAFDLMEFQRLPPELQEQARAQVLQVPVVQRDLELHYRLELLRLGDERAVRAEITSQSVYQNVTGQWQEVTVRASVVPLDEELAPHVSDHGPTGITKGEGEGQSDFPDTLDGSTVSYFVVTRRGTNWFERSTRLGPHARLEVRLEQVAYFFADDWVDIEALLPTVGMTCLADAEGLILRAAGDETLGDRWTQVPDSNGAKAWRLRGAALPGQGFQLRWQPAEPEADEAHEADEADAE